MTDLVHRLRQYRGGEMDTTECYNGLRDEAAFAIEALRHHLEQAYGLLWMDRPREARGWLLKWLDKDGQARGIAKAREYSGVDGDFVPDVVERAVKALMRAAEDAAENAEIRGDDFTESIRIRAAAIMLDDWAKGGSR